MSPTKTRQETLRRQTIGRPARKTNSACPLAPSFLGKTSAAHLRMGNFWACRRLPSEPARPHDGPTVRPSLVCVVRASAHRPEANGSSSFGFSENRKNGKKRSINGWKTVRSRSKTAAGIGEWTAKCVIQWERVKPTGATGGHHCRSGPRRWSLSTNWFCGNPGRMCTIVHQTIIAWQ